MADLPLSSGVLFVGAHPDDETVMAGGTLAMLHTQGIPTYLICATDGRGGETGDIPGIDTPAALASVRAEELRGAALALGADGLTRFCYEDPVVGPDDTLYPFEADERTLAAQIAEHIERQKVKIVLTHGSSGEYGHPAHIQLHRAVLRAVRENTPDVLVYSFAALVSGIEDRIWNVTDPAHFVLDISPWFETKLAALLCHRTQHAMFKRRRKLQTVREAVRRIESYHRHHPAVAPGDRPDDVFAALLRSVGAWTPGESHD
ncbi:MAG: PIG-L family deacetylase [Chloroflexi bacterium]|nr:PIG-L family deacetylase [Chloroflexota bacterium]